MKIFLHEITEQGKELEFTQEEKWVADTVAQLDESLEEESRLPQPPRSTSSLKTRPVQVSFLLRKVDDVIVVTGKAQTEIRLICSRCANPFLFQTRPNISTLFCKDPDMAGIAHLQKTTRGSKGKPVGQTKGFARHEHDASNDHGADLDITYIAEDFIELRDVLTEQLRLQIPFQPLCKETCKGMCAHCGADLNVGRCACAKLSQAHPFAVLKNLKL